MSTKRQPSKQRRQTQNQKQRAALEARTAAAAAAASSPAGEPVESSSTELRPRRSVLSRFRGRQEHRASDPRRGRRARRSAIAPRSPRSSRPSRRPWSARSCSRCPSTGSASPSPHRPPLVAEWSLSAQDALADASPTPRPTSWRRRSTTGCRADPSPTSRRSSRCPLPCSSRSSAPAWASGPCRSGRSAKVVNRTMYVTLFGALLAVPAADRLPPRGDQPRGGGLPGAQGRGARPRRRPRPRTASSTSTSSRRTSSTEDDGAGRGRRSSSTTRSWSRSPTTSTSVASAASGRARRGSGPSRRWHRDPGRCGGEVGDLLGQPPQGERHRVGLRLRHVDAVAAQPGTDLGLLEGEGLGAGRRSRRDSRTARAVSVTIRTRSRGVHQEVSTRGGPASRTAASSSK